MKNGILVTSDPYSKIVDKNDKNTAMLFGDGAAATLLTNNPEWVCLKFDFGTDGSLSDQLEVGLGRRLFMNGRSVFSFSATRVPPSIASVLQKEQMTIDDIDKVFLHQGSKYIVDTIGTRIRAGDKTQFYASEYGNLVSSSIPVAMADNLNSNDNSILISGFGVGLSWASTILKRC